MLVLLGEQYTEGCLMLVLLGEQYTEGTRVIR